MELPPSVVEIEQGAFRGCTNLRSANIPDSVKEIGDQVFSDCPSLGNVKLPPRFFGKLSDLGAFRKQWRPKSGKQAAKNESAETQLHS